MPRPDASIASSFVALTAVLVALLVLPNTRRYFEAGRPLVV